MHLTYECVFWFDEVHRLFTLYSWFDKYEYVPFGIVFSALQHNKNCHTTMYAVGKTQSKFFE